MRINKEFLQALTHGAVRIEEHFRKFDFFRMTDAQMQIYQGDFQVKCRASAGIRLEFMTDAREIFMKCRFEPGSSRKFAFMDVVVNGVMVQHEGVEDIFQNPDFTLCVKLDGTLNRVAIYLPCLAKTTLELLDFIGETKVIPIRRPRTMLAFGDSITQGNDARHPSLAYPTQIADALNMELFNKAVGGDIFNPALLNEPEPCFPDMITVAYGTNDWTRCTENELSRNSSEFFERLAILYPGVPVYVILPIWRDKCESTVTEVGTFAHAAEIIRMAREKNPAAKIINGMTLVPHLTECFADGYLHPGDMGFLYMGSNLLRAIN